jgi:hypothetical protein
MNSTWTPETIRGLGATTDLPTLGRIFRIGRDKSYRLARTGEWEQAGIQLVRIGNDIRVTVASILTVLGHPDTQVTSPPADPPPGPGTHPATSATQP